MQPQITEKFLKFLGCLDVLRLAGETKAFSGKVEEVDVQSGPILLRHRDGRCSLAKAARFDFMSEAKV
jgi:hypothetical protein